MNMFGLEGSGFIIAISLTLLISGMVVYYCTAKINRLEMAVAKQNQVLSSFITNVQAELQGGHGIPDGPPIARQESGPVTELATSEAEEAARTFNDASPHDKITVSDDDTSSEHDEDDSDSEEESDDSDDDGNDTPILNIGAPTDNVKIVDMTDSHGEEDNNDVNAAIIEEVNTLPLGNGVDDNAQSKTISLSLQLEEILSDTNDDSTDDIDDSDEDSTDDATHDGQAAGEEGNQIDVLKLDSHLTSEDSELSESPQTEISMDIKKMKVKELKKLVTTKGLASPALVKSMKKTELVSLLSK